MLFCETQKGDLYMGNNNHIRLKIPGETFWAYRYPDLPENQAEINNHLLSNEFSFGDRVEFDENRNVTRLIKRREDIQKESHNA